MTVSEIITEPVPGKGWTWSKDEILDAFQDEGMPELDRVNFHGGMPKPHLAFLVEAISGRRVDPDACTKRQLVDELADLCGFADEQVSWQCFNQEQLYQILAAVKGWDTDAE